jgi:group I intron endonuclease
MIYYNAKRLIKEKIAIYDAILKYGHSNFSLEILEYCDQSDLIKREQYYFDSLKPEYNILKTAGSLLGFKHSEQTREKIRDKMIGENHHFFGRTHSEETIEKIRVAHLGKKYSEESKEKISRTKGYSIYSNPTERWAPFILSLLQEPLLNL